MKNSFMLKGFSLLFIFATLSEASLAGSTKSELNKEIELLEKQITPPQKVRSKKIQHKAKKKVVRTNILPPKKVKKAQNLPAKPVVVAEYEPIHPPVVPVQQVVTETHYADVSSPRKPWGINVFTFYSFADRFNSSNNSATSVSNSFTQHLVDYTGEYSSNPSFGIGVEYSKKSIFEWSEFGFGFDVGVSYEFNRTIKRQYIQASNSNAFGAVVTDYGYDDPELAIVLPYINANFSMNETYLFTGINYTVPQESGADDEEFAGRLGFQVGFGMQITSYLALEMSHRWMSFDVDPIFPDNNYFMTLDSYRLNHSGIGVSEKETLDLNGFNLAIKATF